MAILNSQRHNLHRTNTRAKHLQLWCTFIYLLPPSTLHSSPKCTVATPVLHPPPQSPSNSGPWLPLLSAYQQYPPWHTHNKGQNLLEFVWAGFQMTWKSMCNMFWKSSKSAKLFVLHFYTFPPGQRAQEMRSNREGTELETSNMATTHLILEMELRRGRLFRLFISHVKTYNTM